MKKLIILSFIFVTVVSCTCLSQIPPQYIYVGSNCTAVLPDFRDKVQATDNCSVSSLIQIPAAGYILNSINATVVVTIKATDIFGNFSQVHFNVSLRDTTPPVIDTYGLTVDTDWERINLLYDRADLAVIKKMEEFDASFPYEQWGLLRDDHDSTYYKNRMLVWSDRARAKTGHGYRFWTFQNRDTIIFGQ
jgi:hypothetical protein